MLKAWQKPVPMSRQLFSKRDFQLAEEVVNGIRVLRIQSRKKNETGKYSYLYGI